MAGRETGLPKTWLEDNIPCSLCPLVCLLEQALVGSGRSKTCEILTNEPLALHLLPLEMIPLAGLARSREFLILQEESHDMTFSELHIHYRRGPTFRIRTN